ncbi:MAG TPA: hypothetical protein VFA41_06880 [Ktedonobacteraceae bacterium]|nr:hypothetical protein [Ktedonobacteraceae bacterium]
MLCPTCNAFRPASAAPCPNCGAPSPLSEDAGGFASPAANWGASSWNNQMPFAPPPAQDNSLWPQATQSAVQQQPQSLLPVPYAPPAQAQQGLMPLSPGMTTIQLGGAQVPMIPAETGVDAPVYVPPMYTKPRPIIPRYRAISGLISFVVVIALLCTGAGFYAKASGKLSFIHSILGDSRPANITPSPAANLRIPPAVPTYGPAVNVINSATTASSITNTNQPKFPTNQFHVGDTIYLTFSAHPTKSGSVVVKWYTGNNYNFYAQSSTPINETKGTSFGYTEIRFSLPVEGMVELYWNDQFAIRLYFVVLPA